MFWQLKIYLNKVKRLEECCKLYILQEENCIILR